MSFREIFRFEVERQLRRPTTALYLAVLAAPPLAVASMPGAAVVNAPFNVANVALVAGMLGTLVTGGLFVEAGQRDLRWRMHPLFYTAPVGKPAYLGGRFAGALLVNALLLLAVPAAMLVGTRMPSVAPENLGPFRAGAYLLAYFVVLLPNLLLNAAVLFGATVLGRRSLHGYLAALGLLAANLALATVAVEVESRWISALLDPLGVVALKEMAEDWTRVERSTRLVAVEGLLLWNRLLWTALAAGVLAFTWRRFRLAHPEPASRRRRARKADPATAQASDDPDRRTAVAIPAAPRAFGLRARLRQTVAVAGEALRQTVGTREFAAVAAGLVFMVFNWGPETLTDPVSGTRLWPLTHRVTGFLTEPVFRIVVALLTAFFAGELVWRAREARIHELGDTRPVPDWVPFAGNLLALGGIVATMQAVLMAAGVLLQARLGFARIEPGLYLEVLFGLQLIDYLLFAVLALLVHVVVNQKYVGHLAAMLLFAAILQARRLGVEHNLLVYGGDPGWVYSDLAGFGPFLRPFAWFNLYWAGWALLLGVAALLFWVRGTETGARRRLRAARARFTRRVAAGAGAAALLVGATGGFIFHNTNVLHEHRTPREAEAVNAEYERRYRRFARAPRPVLTGVRLRVELHPERGAAEVDGTYTLVNRTGAPIESVHLSTVSMREVSLRGVRFDGGARAVREDAAHGYRVYALRRALAPGDSVRMRFAVAVERRGFPDHGVDASIVANGTFLHGASFLPAIGYETDAELSAAAARKRHGLPPGEILPAPDDSAARRVPAVAPHAEWIDFEATVGTAPDQTALLPGTLRRSWTEGGRRYFHYRSETPVLSFLALFSGRYAVATARWRGVEIRVLHHPGHAFNLGRVLRGAQTSLELFSAQFGPYPHRQLTLVEVPRYGLNGARAYPATVAYSEASPIPLARMAKGDAAERPDAPLWITAHEIAHQWWGHQLRRARVQGSALLSETLAQYSALLVLEKTHGPEAVHRALRTLHLGYLAGRGTHETPEVPLLRTTDHDYLHYDKGAVAMYTLKAYLGEARVNAALRRLVETHGLKGAPYPTSLDLHRELRAVTPDSLQYLLHDLLATITLWELRATEARAEPLGGGEYRVTIGVRAAKVRSDGAGNETEVPMDDLVEIGVYPEAEGGRSAEPLHLGLHRVRSGARTITVTVRGKPARVAVDPFDRLIARGRDALGSKAVEVEIGGDAARPGTVRSERERR